MLPVMRKKTIINNKDGLKGHQFEGFLPVQDNGEVINTHNGYKQ